MSSGVFLTLISVQRVILIRSLNQNTQAFTWKKTFGYFCLLWTILILLQLLPALRVWGQMGVKDGLPYCTVWSEGVSDFTDINKLIHMFGYFLPFIFPWLSVSNSSLRKEVPLTPSLPLEATFLSTLLYLLSSFLTNCMEKMPCLSYMWPCTSWVGHMPSSIPSFTCTSIVSFERNPAKYWRSK